eukprot:TRINITY_DN4169_c0_g1_i11.p1 TRINITY_DN4169_c0_g1~~TRINITY_DN4169_c0_g1_i11.p1  ORF type:complete len:127 (+),score=32.68 TRINITY_DN4169_c0_g1_i11:151-531(+)
METAEQQKVALTPYDDKRMWYGVSHSEPYGMGGEDYQKELVLEKIVENCGKRVGIDREKFLEYLGCPLEDFKKQIENDVHIYCSLINQLEYHTVSLGDRNLKDEGVLRTLCHHSNLFLVEEKQKTR